MLDLYQRPVHASCLNQIEIYFSILQRKALTPNNFASLDALANRTSSPSAAGSRRRGAELVHMHDDAALASSRRTSKFGRLLLPREFDRGE